MTSYFTVEQTQKMEAAAKRIAEKPVMETITYETDAQVASVRKMLADGIEMYGAPEALNILVTDILTSLIAHIDDQDANIKAAIAVGRYAAAGTSIDPIIQWMVQHGWLDAGNEYTTADLVSALTDNCAAEGR